MRGYRERLDALIVLIPTPFATLALASDDCLLPCENPFDTVMHHGSQCPRSVATDTARGIG